MKYFFINALLLTSIFASAQEIAFTLADKELVPECIAWSAKQKSFYITSIHKSKIIRYDPATGITTDFITSMQDGYDGGIGLIIDEKRNTLWSACGRKYGNEYVTGIFAWDLQTVSLKQKYFIKDTIPRLFNDLALDKNGNVYVTDTYDSKIYFFNTTLKEPLLYLDNIQYPNGISIGPRNSLFIASHTKGIIKINIPDKSMTFFEQDSMSHTSRGIDGLKYYKKSLIGVFNGAQTLANHKLIRYYLDQKRQKGRKAEGISEIKIMDANNPHFLIPTTGVIVKNHYYLIANSNLSLLDQDTNTFPDKSKLKESVILRYRL